MNELEISAGFFATPDRYLWHPATATAILADLHLGAEAELTRRGILMPDVSTAALESAWNALCQRLAAAPPGAQVIIAGDLFDTPSPDAHAQSAAQKLIHRLPQNCTATLLLGNHDPPLPAMKKIFSDLPVRIETTATAANYRILHGHEIPPAQQNAAGLIVGHQHPAIVLRDRVQSAKMICYAICHIPAWPAPLIILPSFSRGPPLGSNLLTEHHWILDLPRPADQNVRIAGIIEPANVPGQVLDFGPLSALRLPF